MASNFKVIIKLILDHPLMSLLHQQQNLTNKFKKEENKCKKRKRNKIKKENNKNKEIESTIN